MITTGDTEYARCVTCGKVYHIKEMDAGHWIPRNRLGTFMHEQNVHAQCRGCNRFGHGRPVEYQARLLELYGDDILQDLTHMAQKQVKLTGPDYAEMEREYKERARVIEENEVVPSEWADVFLQRALGIVAGRGA